MNKKISLKSVMVAILIIAVCVFLLSNKKYDILNMNAEDIKSIYIENQDSGMSIEITDQNTISLITKNLNTIKVKRYNPSEDYAKTNIKMTIISRSGSDIKGAFQTFVIESSQRIFANKENYYTIEGEFDMKLIENLIK